MGTNDARGWRRDERLRVAGVHHDDVVRHPVKHPCHVSLDVDRRHGVVLDKRMHLRRTTHTTTVYSNTAAGGRDPSPRIPNRSAGGFRGPAFMTPTIFCHWGFDPGSRSIPSNTEQIESRVFYGPPYSATILEIRLTTSISSSPFWRESIRSPTTNDSYSKWRPVL